MLYSFQAQAGVTGRYPCFKPACVRLVPGALEVYLRCCIPKLWNEYSVTPVKQRQAAAFISIDAPLPPRFNRHELRTAEATPITVGVELVVPVLADGTEARNCEEELKICQVVEDLVEDFVRQGAEGGHLAQRRGWLSCSGRHKVLCYWFGAGGGCRPGLRCLASGHYTCLTNVSVSAISTTSSGHTLFEHSISAVSSALTADEFSLKY